MIAWRSSLLPSCDADDSTLSLWPRQPLLVVLISKGLDYLLKTICDMLYTCDADSQLCTGNKRRRPHAPASQPVAKKGRLLKQSSSGIKEEPMTAASDAESMDEVVSPARKSKKALVDSDDEEFLPGGDGLCCCVSYV